MHKKKKALITGVMGQDGSYLAEFLFEKGYEVYGLINTHKKKIIPYERDIFNKISLIWGDLADIKSLQDACKISQPNEVYNLAAISDLSTAEKYPEKTIDINFTGVKRLLEATRLINPSARFFQALSGRIFDNGFCPQNEETPFIAPQNPYDKAKRKVYEEIIVPYREKNNFFICGGFLFNHESPRRDNRFVTRKITQSLARIKNGSQEILELGNLGAKRDWGFAGDYVEAMWMMLQQDKPNDYVIATGEIHTVKEFVDQAASAIDISILWEGEGINIIGKDKTGKTIIKCNSLFFKEENSISVGDISKIKKKLGWAPKTSFRDLVVMMVKADISNI